MSNTHTEEANRDLAESSLFNDWTETERLILATRAQAEATLALAYEQRTANLIALFGEGFAGADLHLSDIFKQIQERLGSK